MRAISCQAPGRYGMTHHRVNQHRAPHRSSVCRQSRRIPGFRPKRTTKVVGGAPFRPLRCDTVCTMPSLRMGADHVRAHASGRHARKTVPRGGVVATWRFGLTVRIEWIRELAGVRVQWALRQPSHQRG
jgi:hypothetical protein